MPKELTFVIDPAGDFPSVGLLSDAIQHIRRLLRDLDDSIYGQTDRQDWRLVSIHSSAPTITVAPARDDTQAVGALAEGLQAVTEGTDQPPPGFTEPLLEHLKNMKKLYQGKGRAESIAVLMDGKEMANIRSDIAEKALRILSVGHHNLGGAPGQAGSHQHAWVAKSDGLGQSQRLARPVDVLAG